MIQQRQVSVGAGPVASNGTAVTYFRCSNEVNTNSFILIALTKVYKSRSHRDSMVPVVLKAYNYKIQSFSIPVSDLGLHLNKEDQSMDNYNHDFSYKFRLIIIH